MAAATSVAVRPWPNKYMSLVRAASPGHVVTGHDAGARQSVTGGVALLLHTARRALGHVHDHLSRAHRIGHKLGEP